MTQTEGAAVEVEHDLFVAAADGIRLATDIYRPTGPGRYPVLIQRTPYGKRMAGANGAHWIGDLVDGGYAVVIQDTRGRFNSEGEWRPFFDEIADGADTVAWAASQPWSNGRVGMLGGSYHGLTQLLAAAAAPEGLEAITPYTTCSDLHENWVFHAGGVLDLNFAVGWTAMHAVEEATRRGISDPVLDQLEESSAALLAGVRQGRAHEAIERQGAVLEPLFAHRPLKEIAALREAAPFFREWLEHPDADAYWAEIAPASHYHRMRTPALHVSGWYDNFLGGTIANYLGMRAHAATERARRGQRLVLGPWHHGSIGQNPVPLLGDVSFDPAGRFDLRGLERRWLDCWLKDVENGVMDEAPIRIFVMGADRWRDEQDWPLPDTIWTRYYLDSGGAANGLEGDGRLSPQPPSGAPSDRFAFDPRNPVPTRGGAVLVSSIVPGMFDQRAVEGRPDVLVYTSQPLSEDLEVTGPVEVELHVMSTAPDTDFTAKLVDVHPDGEAMNLCDGIIRTRYRFGAAAAVLMQPGTVQSLRIDMLATSNLFRAGHRIRIEISSSNYPHHQPNPNTGAPFDSDTLADLRVAEQTILHDRLHPSCVVLPVIRRAP